MLGNPSMFTEITERNRGGFDSLLNLINKEALMFQQNRELAKKQAADMKLEEYRAQLDVNKARAIEEIRAEVAANRPISNESRIRLELDRSNKLMEQFMDTDNMRARFGYNQITSRLIQDPSSGVTHFQDFGVGVKDGQLTYNQIDANAMMQQASIFRKADEVSNEISSVISAGLDANGFTVNNQKYFGSVDLEGLNKNLLSNDLEDIAQALALYEANKGNIPSVDLVRSRGQSISETQRQGINKFMQAKGSFKTTRETAQPYLTDMQNAFTNMSVGMVHEKLKEKLNAILLPHKGSEDKLLNSRNTQETTKYIALKNYTNSINEMMLHYRDIPGAKSVDFSELYLNEEKTTDNVDFFTTRKPQATSNTSTSSTNGTYGVTDAYTNKSNQLLYMFHSPTIVDRNP
jgi:hypothetical protein